MTGKQRVLAKLRGEPTDSLPLMPIAMMFAADLAGVHYRDYARDHRVLAEAQLAVADRFDFDHVSAISDPAREASDLGGAVEWFDDQPPAIVESRALLDEKSKLAALRLPDPAAPGRMRDRVEAVR
ncbi:MAG: uroporphyrinogen decarboxylase family protein, partial [Bryobacteraceae bacterium]